MSKLIEIVKEWRFDSDGKPVEYAVQDGSGGVKFGDGHAVLNHYSGVWHRQCAVCYGACAELAEDWNTKILTYEEWKEYHSKPVKTDYKVGDKVRVIKPEKFEAMEDDNPASTSVTGKFLTWMEDMDEFVGEVFTLKSDDIEEDQLVLDKGEGYWSFLFEWVELVEDETEQVKPQDLVCFEEVVKVIGDKAAEVELQKVIYNEESRKTIQKGWPLRNAFIWNASPQGYAFWENVLDGVIPKEYRGTPKSIVDGAFSCVGVVSETEQKKTLEDFLEKAAELDRIMYHTSIDCDKLIVIERPNGSLAEVSIEDFFEAADKIIAVHNMFK